jgi:hypothetical protein
MISLWDLALFIGFIVAALLMRRDKDAHKRLMLLAYISIVKHTAVGRLVGISGGPAWFLVIAVLIVMVPAIYDLLSRRRVHRVYLWGGAVILLSMPARLVLSRTDAWLAFTEYLTK